MSGLNAPSFSLLVAGCLLLVSQAALAGDAPASQVLPAQPSSSTVMPLTSSMAADCIPAWLIDATGIRRLPDRCVETATANIEAAVAPGHAPCDPPLVRRLERPPTGSFRVPRV